MVFNYVLFDADLVRCRSVISRMVTVFLGVLAEINFLHSPSVVLFVFIRPIPNN